jgi:SAM-dependent methyltransferase
MIFSGGRSEGYDRFMGRYSRQLAAPFADFADVRAGMSAVDVGAGTGALTAELATRLGNRVAVAEPSPAFVETLRERFPGLDVRETAAERLPWPDGGFDAALSQLVVTFLADPQAGMAEQRRVVRPGGVVAAAMWERDGIEVLRVVRDALARVRRQAADDGGPGRDYRTVDELVALFGEADLRDVSAETIDVDSTYASFDELWEDALDSPGPNARAVAELGAEQRAEARGFAAEALGNPGGAFTLGARCIFVRGTV